MVTVVVGGDELRPVKPKLKAFVQEARVARPRDRPQQADTGHGPETGHNTGRPQHGALVWEYLPPGRPEPGGIVAAASRQQRNSAADVMFPAAEVFPEPCFPSSSVCFCVWISQLARTESVRLHEDDSKSLIGAVARAGHEFHPVSR